MSDRANRVTDAAWAGRSMRHVAAAIAAATVRLPNIDPITTEIVRVRCADHHDCHT